MVPGQDESMEFIDTPCAIKNTRVGLGRCARLAVYRTEEL